MGRRLICVPATIRMQQSCSRFHEYYFNKIACLTSRSFVKVHFQGKKIVVDDSKSAIRCLNLQYINIRFAKYAKPFSLKTRESGLNCIFSI